MSEGELMQNPLYWIGIRESEIEDVCNLFDGSITIFGSGQDGNRSFEREYKIRYDYNQDHEAWYYFVKRNTQEIIQYDPDCRFMLYDPDEAELYGSEVATRIVCQNPVSLLQLLADKFQTRQWLSDHVPILHYQMRCGAEIRYSDLRAFFPDTDSFVIQGSYSCGGSGTWLLTEENQEGLLEQLDPETLYAITPYLKNSISPNIHIIIFRDAVLLLPPSVQLLEINGHGFTYKGADYPMYLSLPKQVDLLLKSYAKRLGEILRRAGYRGVCGIDFLLSEGNLYLMEINARFQSSTFLLNRAMAEYGWNTSIHALHLEAFRSNTAPGLPRTLMVPYSFYHYAYESTHRKQLRYFHSLLQSAPESEAACIDDGLDWDMELQSGTYLYKAVFRGAISSPGPEGECRCDGNVCFPAKCFSPEELGQDLERLKLMLLAHGVRLSQTAKAHLAATGGFNHEEFDALDLVLKGHIYVCAPYDTNRCWLSPFCVEDGPDGDYSLTYYGSRIISICVRQVDALGEKKTCGGILYHDVTYLGNDRLRVYQRLGCFFKNCGKGCQFCDFPMDDRELTLKDIYQAIDEYRDHPHVRHYLIGGGSNPPNDDFHTVIQIAKHIRNTTGKPIYLMSLPPEKPEILQELKKSGITQIAFNLEIFDRDLALKYMPGKGAIPFSVYDQAFRAAVDIWGRSGDVRTIFVVGLEPMGSLLRGINYAAGFGVSPILSLFRPVPGTPLHSFQPPPDNEIWKIYQQAKAICSRHDIALGPACPYCQDNCLKITFDANPAF